ncbi:MAG: CocE/NonD family hydrolase [Solirubrobacteraceae bacterium]
MTTRCVLAISMGVLALLPATVIATPSEPEPFKSTIPGGAGLKCSATASYEGEVRFCEGNGKSERVPSWDGVPLDVDVTLPPASDGSGPYPTIVMLHGWGESKTSFESQTPTGDGSITYHYNNDYYARQGYAVVNYTARGFGNSCGDGGSPVAQTQISGECAKGFIRLADQRYEVRDTEYLLGLLVDEHIAKVGSLAVTGISYGGGQSVELAYLRNRIRCAGSGDPYTGLGKDPCEHASENALVPWVSPAGTPLEITAAYARWPWSDLASALIPNGRFLDYDGATDGADGSSTSKSPIGVPIQSYTAGLFADGAKSGYDERPGENPEWDLTKDFALTNLGEPESTEDQQIVNDIVAYHGGYGLPGTPAPLLMESGWNDDLFPPRESLRVYDSVLASDPHAYVALQFGDVGHSRASNKPKVNEYFNDQGAAFFAERLQDKASAQAPAAGSVTTFTTTCPAGPSGAPDGGPFEASSWKALQRGAVEFSSSSEQTITAPGGNPVFGVLFDPIFQDTEPNACKTVQAEDPLGTATYTTISKGFTLMGLPTVIAKVSPTGTINDDGQLDARLWDVSPAGQQLLVSRGGYRLEEPSPSQIVFQLHGNGYYFPAGDTVKLELITNDTPYYRAPNGAFTVAIKSAQMVLPTYEKPNGEQIKPPESVNLPLPESPPASPAGPSSPGGSPPSTSSNTKAAQAISLLGKATCAGRSKVRIHLPHYPHARVTQVVILVNGRRTATIHGHSLRSVLVSLEHQSAAQALTLRLRVKGNRRTSTHSIKHSYRLCA